MMHHVGDYTRTSARCLNNFQPALHRDMATMSAALPFGVAPTHEIRSRLDIVEMGACGILSVAHERDSVASMIRLHILAV
jgi:hypothetical protein